MSDEYWMNQKFCTKCHQAKPLTDKFWWHQPGRKDGYHSRCIECMKAYHRAHYRKNAAREIERARVLRQKRSTKAISS